PSSVAHPAAVTANSNAPPMNPMRWLGISSLRLPNTPRGRSGNRSAECLDFQGMEIILIGAAVVVGLATLFSSVRVLQQYQRGVVFRLGQVRQALAGPGVKLLAPFGIDRMRVVDVRTRAIQISPQEVITHDNISIVVDAVVYASIASASHAILEVEDYMPATLQLASTTLRAVLGKMDLDDILAHRDAI